MRILVGLSLFFISLSSIAQWKPLSGNSITPLQVCSSKDFLYASTATGIYSSADGKDWNYLGDGGPFNGYGTLGVAVNDTCVLEASLYGIFYSKFNGTWNTVGTAATTPKEKMTGVVSTAENIFAYSSSGTLFSFDPLSNQWTLIKTPSTIHIASTGKSVMASFSNVSDVWSFIASGQNGTIKLANAYDTELYAFGDTLIGAYSNRDSVALSLGVGSTIIRHTMPGNGSVQGDFQKWNSNLYASMDGPSSGFYVTTDFGSNWTSANVGLSDSSILFLEILKGDIFAFGRNAVSKRQLSQLTGIIYSGAGKLEAVNLAGASYQWFLNGVAIVGATNRTFLASENGSYKVILTEKESNLRIAANVVTYSYQVDDLVISATQSGNEMSKVTFSYDQSNESIQIFAGGDLGKVTVTNICGQEILHQQVMQSTVIHLHPLPEGLYLVHLTSGSEVKSFKFYKN